MLEGVLPVLVTPFTDDLSVDHEALREEVEWLLAQGVDGVVVGMVSETLRLSSEERDAVAASVCRASDGRGAVVTSVGAESLHTAVRHARAAEACGASAVMAIPPVAVAASTSELMRYFSGLITAVEVPVVVQDASGYLGRPLDIDMQAALHREFGDRVAFKPEAEPIGANLSALRDATDGRASIFEGSGGLALVDSYRRGIAGTMPGVDIIWAIVALWRALGSGDQAMIDLLNGPVCAFVSLQGSLDSFVAVQKHLLVKQGVLRNARSRGPVAFVLDPETRDEAERRFALVRSATDEYVSLAGEPLSVAR